MPRLDRLLSLYCYSPLRKMSTVKKTAIPILMYHSISDETESGHPYFWINTSKKRFAEHMQFLKENDYKVISLAEAVEILKSAQNIPIGMFKESEAKHCSSSSYPSSIPMSQEREGFPHRYVVLTFDDGFHDFQEYAWPILSGFGFTATVFVPTDFIGNKRKLFNGRECLAWPEIRELHSHGITFGSHTLSHSKLYGLPWNEIWRELLDSRLRLEDELKTPANCFAYPYAFPQEDRSFILRFRQELIDQGYITAVTTVIGCAQQGSDPLCLKRLPVNGNDDERLLKAKLSGAYDWLAGAQTVVRRTKQYSRRLRFFRTTSNR